MKVSAAGPPRITQTARVLIVGDGAMAAEHARAFRTLATAQLTGVVGKYAHLTEHFADRFGVTNWGTDLRRVIETASPDIIVVAVAVPAIPTVYRQVLQTDATLLLEKPFGADLLDAEDLAVLARRRTGQTFVAMNRRQFGGFRLLRRHLALESGPRLVQILDQQSFDHPRAAGFSEGLIAKWMYANAIHLVDLIPFLTRGEVNHVSTRGWSRLTTDPQLVSARVELTSGDVGTYEALWSTRGPWAASVTTQSLRWEMRPLEQARWKKTNDQQWHEISQTRADRYWKPGLLRQAQQVIRAANGMDHDLVTPDVALNSIRLLSLIYQDFQ